jgi:ATP-dependent RNA helicase RhlE
MKRLIDKVEVPDFVPSAAPPDTDERPPREPRPAHQGKRGERERREQKPAQAEGSRQGKPQGPRPAQGQGQGQGQGRPQGQRQGASQGQGQQRAKPQGQRRTGGGQQDDDFGNRVDYQPRQKSQYRDPEAPRGGGHRHGNGGNPNRGTPAALEEARRQPVTLTGRRTGEAKPALFNSPRSGGNGGNGSR